MEKKPITPLAAGLIIGLTSVVLFFAYYYTGLVFQREWYAWLPAIVYVALVIVFISLWSNAQNNFITYGNCFGFGFKSVCIATLIVFFVTLVFIYLTPEYKDQMMQVVKDQMRQNKQMTDDQVDKGVEMYSRFFMVSTLGGSLFGNLLVGTIGALIGAAVAKKKPLDPFVQANQIGEPQP